MANTVYKKLLVLAGTKLGAPLPASVLFRKILVHEHATFHTQKRYVQLEKMNWRKFWLLLIPLISIISLGIGAAIYQKNKLEECSIESIGIIYDIYSIKKRGEFVHYKYTVNGEQYKTSESIRTKDDYVKFNIGDTIRINYACESPNSSRYISENENLSGNK